MLHQRPCKPRLNLSIALLGQAQDPLSCGIDAGCLMLDTGYPGIRLACNPIRARIQRPVSSICQYCRGFPVQRYGSYTELYATMGYRLHLKRNRNIIPLWSSLNIKTWRLRMRYKIVLNKTDEGYSVSCPGLPGCWSQGDTEPEAIDNIKDAIEEYLAAIYDSIKDQKIREIEIAL